MYLAYPSMPVNMASSVRWTPNKDSSRPGRATGRVQLRHADSRDQENTPELMAIIERQFTKRVPDCAFLFHGWNCGKVRFDKKGRRKPCLGDIQKAWDTGCEAIGMGPAASRTTSAGQGSSTTSKRASAPTS